MLALFSWCVVYVPVRSPLMLGSTRSAVTMSAGVTRRDAATLAALVAAAGGPAISSAEDYAYQPALKGKDYGKSQMGSSDFTKTPSGLSYKDGTIGKGKVPQVGDRVVIDWTGYTIGYFGRPFETKKLRELDQLDDSFYRFVLGQKTVIPALEEGLLTMAEGGVRQLVVPPGIGYPPSDPGHEKVLENQELIDKTLLFNVKLVRVDAADGNGGFTTVR